MRILQVITRTDTVGGAQKHLYDISTELAKNGHTVKILSSGNGKFYKLIEKSGIPFYDIETMKREFSLINDIKSIIKIRKKVLEFKPDVVAAHSAKAGLLVRLSCIGIKTKVFFTAHGWSHIRTANSIAQSIFKNLELVLSYFCQRVICVSQADTDYAISYIGIKKEKVVTIHNGVFKPGKVSKPHYNSNEFNILSVVRFQAPKDFETLIRGLEQISEYNFHLKIVGDGPDFNSVKSKIDSSKLSNKVSLEGFKTELDCYYSEADVVILISKSEGLPMSLIEGMSFGKPLIATDIGGISEVINDTNGFLIPPLNAECLAEAIKSCIELKRNKDDRLGEGSRSFFDKKFNFLVMYKKLLALYSSN